MTTTGRDLIAAGATQGAWFGAALAAINNDGMSIADAIERFQPPPSMPLSASRPFFKNIRAESEDEQENINAVFATMEALMRTPVVVSGAVMPDACPAGPIGTIPVGGVVASTEIHPGMHSADVCCSMAITMFEPGTSPAALLNAVHDVTHFGPGGRGDIVDGAPVLDASNPFLRDAVKLAPTHFATQGDGNHFAFVGVSRETGLTALVTHHGSRGPGAAVYKEGMRIAEKFRQRLSPETLKSNAWIPSASKEGEQYWAALQAIREWTKVSHFAIHNLAAHYAGARRTGRFWNEHNFVFRKSDGLFYHAKGATPAFAGWAHDAGEFTIIPMNMAQPVLITRGLNPDNGLGFSPHGAGRNFSRAKHKARMGHMTDAEIFAAETAGIDARFFMGIPDISELPSAYKDANTVRRQISEFGLAEIVDEIMPYGCIMAGDWQKDAPWKRKDKANDRT